MNTTINISLNVPPSFQLELLKQQLTDFGNWLIVTKDRSGAADKTYRHQSLRGLTRDIELSSEELIGKYLKEKYSV